MDKATTLRVAQALSRAIDEYQELTDGLYLDDGPDHEGATLRVNEVSAELKSNGPISVFTVHTSDGQEWCVRVGLMEESNLYGLAEPDEE